MTLRGGSEKPLRIAFFGLPLAALLLARDGHEIVHAAICRDDAVGLYRLRRTFDAAKVSLKPRIDAAFLEMLRQAAPDVVVSWFWTKKLPPAALKLARLGALGVHPSLLPRHRGPDPYFWAIDSGDAETGVSAHWLEAEYDTGAVIAQRTLAIDPHWNAWQLARALDRPSLGLLRAVLRQLGHGEDLPGVRQDERAATPAPAPTDADLEIDWNAPCARIAARIRAAAPTPGAFTDLGGEEFVIIEASILLLSEGAAALAALAPGEMALIDGVPVIRASDGGILVRRAQFGSDEEPESGNALHARLAAFLRGTTSAPM